MAYKNRPYQYLLTVKKGYEDDWAYVSSKAEEMEVPIADLIRKIIRKQVEEWRHNHNSE